MICIGLNEIIINQYFINALTTTLTEIRLYKKILDSEIQMNNYIIFRADRTLGAKIVMYKHTSMSLAEAHDAEQLIAKSNSCVAFQFYHMRKRNVVIITFQRPRD